MSPSLFSSLRNRLSSGHIATSASTLLPFSLQCGSACFPLPFIRVSVRGFLLLSRKLKITPAAKKLIPMNLKEPINLTH